MISQHWFGANVDLDLCRHMAPLGHNELNRTTLTPVYKRQFFNDTQKPRGARFKSGPAALRKTYKQQEVSDLNRD